MDWDHIGRTMRDVQDVARRFSDGPMAAYVKRQREFDEVVKRFSGPPFDDFIKRQVDAFSDGSIQAVIQGLEKFDVASMTMAAALAVDHISALDNHWKSIASKLDLDLAGPGGWITDLQEARLDADAEVADPISDDTGVLPTAGGERLRVRRAAAVARVLQGARNVLVVARDRTKSYKARYAALSFYLALFALILGFIPDKQRDAADDRANADLTSAVRKGSESIVSELQRLHAQGSRRDTKSTAITTRPSPLRASRSARSERIASLLAGQIVRVLRHSGNWLLVEVVTTGEEPLLGWMHIANLRLTLDR